LLTGLFCLAGWPSKRPRFARGVDCGLWTDGGLALAVFTLHPQLQSVACPTDRGKTKSESQLSSSLVTYIHRTVHTYIHTYIDSLAPHSTRLRVRTRRYGISPEPVHTAEHGVVVTASYCLLSRSLTRLSQSPDRLAFSQPTAAGCTLIALIFRFVEGAPTARREV
jgi:hypothetical protein